MGIAMSCIAVTLSAAALLVLVASCGGGSDERLGDAQTLLREAQVAMQELDSYRATITISGEGIVGSGEAIESDWTAPDSFRTVTPMLRVEGTGDCGRQKAGELRPPLCTDVRGETLEGYGDAVLVDGRWYGRWCQEKGSQCNQWEVSDAGPLAIMGVTFTHAEWTKTALTMVEGPEVVGEERIGGLRTIHLRGQLNTAQSKVETARRAAESAGLQIVGEECVEEEEQTPVPEGKTAIPSTPTCRAISAEEFLATWEEYIERQQRGPELLDVWIGVDDHLVRRFSAAAPLPKPNGGEETTIISFSRFNELAIQEPR
jgi:hypothetical protein